MRVIRACRELGIATAAIYAESDATAIYVKKANEAYLVGPGPVQGYLDADQIVRLAKRIRADAIHPGYGFLAEKRRICQPLPRSRHYIHWAPPLPPYIC